MTRDDFISVFETEEEALQAYEAYFNVIPECVKELIRNPSAEPKPELWTLILEDYHS